jgi:anti-sigma B factor antagonist
MTPKDTPSINGTPFGVTVKAAGENACIVELVGELDLGTIPRLESPLMRAIDSNDAVILDLSRLSFIDSSGIGLLIDAHRATERTGRLHTVISGASQVERVLTIAGIDRALPVFTDRAEAVAALAPANENAQRPRAA